MYVISDIQIHFGWHKSHITRSIDGDKKLHSIKYLSFLKTDSFVFCFISKSLTYFKFTKEQKEIKEFIKEQKWTNEFIKEQIY